MTRTASQIAMQAQSGQDSMERLEASIDKGASTLDEAAVAKLIAFFRLLDKWDREEKNDARICSNCSEPVQYSIVIMISTVGVSPRVQKSSPAVLFCQQCFWELSERLCSEKLRASVNGALTAVISACASARQLKKSMFD
jgi:hypothetical protein